MSEPHTYDLIDNPSYYAARERLQVIPSASAPIRKPNSIVDKKISKLNKLTVAVVIALFSVAVLAAGSTAIALVTYFNMRAADMEAHITQLSQEVNTTKVRQSNQLQ